MAHLSWLPSERARLTRREFLELSAAAGAAIALSPSGCARDAAAPGIVVNDVHSQLNATRVHRIAKPDSLDALVDLVRTAKREHRPLSIAGGRHAMGGQQFGADTIHVDMGSMGRVLALDSERGLIDVEAGIQWPELIGHLLDAQRGAKQPWGIRQKQTGADRLSIGGALAANVHGRGLRLKPFVGDVESFVLVDAEGTPRTCSREENAELFRLAIGGYGLFGVIATVRLRLAPRVKVQRQVTILDIEDLIPAFQQRIAAGFTYGDFQYATDPDAPAFLRKGVFSCYRPVADDAAMPAEQKALSEDDWKELIYLAHADRTRAFQAYSRYYLSTSGQVYWSDTHQLSTYLDDYHRVLAPLLGTAQPATELITEIYTPRDALARYLADVRQRFRERRTDLIYGTIRLIERDDESLLAWAKQPYACVIFNLHVVHNPAGIERSAEEFRHLIDLAIRYGGSYFLTYHRFARREQVEACYPQFPEFLRAKRRHDPDERFQSDWYRHYRAMFAHAR
ncbi:MAG: FAD-binding protein [Gemmatimonadales bacterium]